MVTRKFDAALLEAVDFAFSSLGKSCEQALYFHLSKTFHIRRTEIPNKVNELDNAIKTIFKGGAIFLERLMLKKLCEVLEVKFDEKDACDFSEAISKIRSMISEGEFVLTISDFSEEVAVDKRKRGGGLLESKG